jgi:DNA-binding MarR family transcriptional regulator
VTRSGADLALLLLAGFRTFADRGSAALAERGFEDVRPVHDFALRAIIAGELARRLSVSRQAAAKTIAALEARQYVERGPDPRDGRRLQLQVTDRGREMLRTGEAVFDDLRAQWEQQTGTAQVAALEEALKALVGDSALPIASPDWATDDLETS